MRRRHLILTAMAAISGFAVAVLIIVFVVLPAHQTAPA